MSHLALLQDIRMYWPHLDGTVYVRVLYMVYMLDSISFLPQQHIPWVLLLVRSL